MKRFQLGQRLFSSKTSKIDNNQAEIQAYYKAIWNKHHPNQKDLLHNNF